ncbi:hypothetical protein M404DRAFT_172469, partial [Pisolithus tinctorius Marx 270]
ASSILIMLAHGPATFLSISLIIHLSALIARNVGGSGLASSFMVSSLSYIPEVHQTAFGERCLLFLPFAIHITSIVATRFAFTLASDTSSPSSRLCLLLRT